MYLFFFMAFIFVAVAFVCVSYFERGKILNSIMSGGFALIPAFFIWMVVTGIATGVSDGQTVNKWEVTDLSRVSTSDGTYYSYYHNDELFDFNGVGDIIRSTTEDHSYRERICTTTPEHFLPLGISFGTCDDYLYVTESDR